MIVRRILDAPGLPAVIPTRFGATVEYVQLPLEAHGYGARESVMDVVGRIIEWYDSYVKPKAAATLP